MAPETICLPERPEVDENQELKTRGGKTMKFTFQPESKPLDGYTIKRAIHRGGFGEVYYALSDAGKEVALKLLRQHLDVELRGVSQCLNLKHPNLVTIFDIRTDNDGDHWVVMEYISGKSLNHILEDHPHGMPMDEVERWLAGMSEGLSFLHDRGIVHRDLKPANVFIENGVVKIGDVGLSKFISESHRSAQTQSVGTVYYMAPEVAHGRYGREVDTYSLGIMLYELLTGRVPFSGESAGEILMKHLSERPDLSQIPMRLRSVVAQALEKDPLRRTPSAARMLEDFRKAIRGFDIPRDIPNESFIGHTVADSSAAQRGGTIPPPPPPYDWKQQVKRDAQDVARHAREAARQAQHWAEGMRSAARKGPFQKWCGGQPNGHHAHFAGTPEAGRAADGKPHQEHPRDRQQILIAAAVLLFALLSSEGMRAIVFSGVSSTTAFLAAIGYGVYRFFKGPTVAQFAPPGPQYVSPQNGPQSAPIPAQPAPLNAPPPAAVKLAVVPPQKPKKPVPLTPETLRTISWRQRMTELTGSLALASLCTAVLVLVIASFTTFLRNSAQAGFFGATTLIASWGILTLSKVTEGRKIDGFIRRLLFLLLGLAIGAAAFGLDQALFIEEYSRGDFNAYGPARITDYMFKSFGPVPLTSPTTNGNGNQPTYAAYLVFFGALFALRHWWWHADSFRKRRFRPMSVLLTTLCALAVVTVWMFPQVWGVTLAAAISSIVQISAAWVPQSDRNALMEVPHGC
ncbi:MAG: serine/threonine protein kinase [Planctomycetaceae bacterium]